MNILDLFLKASLLVKLIMLILIGFSIASWAIIIQRTRILNAAAREAEAFEDKFWSGIELSRLYQESQGKRDNLTGSEQIFYSGFKEFVRLHRANSHAPEAVVEGVHGTGQVVHFETTALRKDAAWTLGVNANLPGDIAVRWVKAV
eukprot:354946_1